METRHFGASHEPSVRSRRDPAAAEAVGAASVSGSSTDLFDGQFHSLLVRLRVDDEASGD
jgi:hypothetical protein